jgi:tetratricopeptide (TPR) repeat protein
VRRSLLHYMLAASAAAALAVLAIVTGAIGEKRAVVFSSQVAAGAQRLFEAGQREAARGALQDALEICPENVVVRRELAMQLAASGEPEEAIEHFRLVLRPSSRDAGAARRLAEMLAQLGDTDGAVEWLRKASELEPENGTHWTELSKLLLRTGDVSAALAAAETPGRRPGRGAQGLSSGPEH